MKTITALTFLLSLNANAAIECAYVLKNDGTPSKKSIPVSEEAIKLARYLNVKTCTGTSSMKFVNNAKQLGGIQFRNATAEEMSKTDLVDVETLKAAISK